MIEYYKNFSLKNLFYINEEGLVCEEEWRNVANYIGKYQSSNLGRAKSLQRVVVRKNGVLFPVREAILKQWISHQGYLFVTLWDKGKHLNVPTSKLVWEAFNNVTLSGSKFVVDHKDNSQRLNNTLSNLQLITGRSNVSKDKKNKSSKYTGVCWNKVRKAWQFNIKLQGKNTSHLGTFEDEDLAGRLYQLAVGHLYIFNGNVKEFRDLMRGMLQEEQKYKGE